MVLDCVTGRVFSMLYFTLNTKSSVIKEVDGNKRQYRTYVGPDLLQTFFSFFQRCVAYVFNRQVFV